ncbi:hypothetical protein PISL3812_06061 [Talaromyces islandicus]|uniref:Uncharacterized protein n=1 Tax=Talaromyces islandicus TaxID=28573 RepID=A0A0U1M1P5_TALIS|nr:hypothetical protein PISL3812_06061 [Talaromyces islandicus]
MFDSPAASTPALAFVASDSVVSSASSGPAVVNQAAAATTAASSAPLRPATPPSLGWWTPNRPRPDNAKGGQRAAKRPLETVESGEVRTLEELKDAQLKLKEEIFVSEEKQKGWKVTIETLQALLAVEKEKSEKKRAERANLCDLYSRRAAAAGQKKKKY